MSRDHRKLDAFHRCDALVMTVYATSRAFPKEELFGLTSQLRRATLSAAANIVEGAAREGEREYLHFLNQARGSLRESGYLIDVATRLGYIDPHKSAEMFEQYDHAARTLSNLIRSLKLPPPS